MPLGSTAGVGIQLRSAGEPDRRVNRRRPVGVCHGVKVDPSFDAYVRERAAGLLRLAYLLTGDRGHAEDLLQTALLRTASHWRQARTAPDAYVRRVLVNLSRDRMRARSRRPTEAPLPVDDAALPAVDAGLDRVGQHGAVTSALASLPYRQRQVIVLRYYADLSVEETAAVMGCSTGAVKSHTSRAVARLREVLDPQLLTEVHNAG